MLDVRDLEAGYGKVQVLFGLSFAAQPGEVTCLMGRNGAGKTTTLRAIMGLVRGTGGSVTLNGERLDNRAAHDIPKAGIALVPQGRRLFADLSVEENLTIGLMTRKSPASARERVLTRFPRLAERLGQRAGTLSGGEQQMLAIGRAMCIEPSVILLDEPTEGLQPSMIAAIREVIAALRDEGVTVVLVEQRSEAVREIADRVIFIENGQVAAETDRSTLATDNTLIHRYVGV